MLRAHALADLFTENLDDRAHAIFLTTPAGNLIGASRPWPLPDSSPLIRKAHVLCALTWRHYAKPPSTRSDSSSAGHSRSASYSNSVSAPGSAGNDSSNEGRWELGREEGAAAVAAARPLRAQPLTVLSLARDGDGQVKTLAVAIENRECVLERLMEGLVIGLLGQDWVETQDGLKRNASHESGGDNKEDGDDRQDEDPEAATAAKKQEQARRVRALSIKASALADYLREELQDFKMPPELH